MPRPPNAPLIFNVLLALVIGAGLLWPAAGQAVDPHRRWLIVGVMFVMALTLPGERLRRAIGNARGLGACAATGYVLLPAMTAAVGWLCFRSEPGLVAGMAVLGALPCTLASAAVWTRLGGGDDALALVYTVVSNLAAVALIPLLLLLTLGRAFEIDAVHMLGSLCLVVLLPVGAGQLLRRLLGDRVDAWKPRISVLARGLVLAIVLVAVSGMAGEIRASAARTLTVVGISASLHGVALLAAAGIGKAAKLPREERIAVLFSGSQKTLFIGVFLAREYFPDDPLALLPVTSYHVAQLVIDTLVAARCSRSSST